MRGSAPQLLPALVLIAGCSDQTLVVGSVRGADSPSDEMALSQLALELDGAWYGTVPGLFGDSDISITFAPTPGANDGAFTMACRAGACVGVELLAWLFGEPQSGQDAARSAASGDFRLVAFTPDTLGGDSSWARCVLTPPERTKPPGLVMSLSLGPDGELLRVRFTQNAYPFHRQPQ